MAIAGAVACSVPFQLDQDGCRTGGGGEFRARFARVVKQEEVQLQVCPYTEVIGGFVTFKIVYIFLMLLCITATTAIALKQTIVATIAITITQHQWASEALKFIKFPDPPSASSQCLMMAATIYYYTNCCSLPLSPLVTYFISLSFSHRYYIH